MLWYLVKIDFQLAKTFQKSIWQNLLTTNISTLIRVLVLRINEYFLSYLVFYLQLNFHQFLLTFVMVRRDTLQKQFLKLFPWKCIFQLVGLSIFGVLPKISIFISLQLQLTRNSFLFFFFLKLPHFSYFQFLSKYTFFLAFLILVLVGSQIANKSF